MSNSPVHGRQRGDVPVRPGVDAIQVPGSDNGNSLNTSSGITDEHRAKAGQAFRSKIPAQVESIAGYVSIGDWTPTESQTLSVIMFDRGVKTALHTAESEAECQEREALGRKVQGGEAVFQSINPEFASALADRFEIAVTNLAKFVRQEALNENPAIGGTQTIEPSSKEYNGELFTSLWIVKAGLTNGVACPALLKQFTDRTNALPIKLKEALTSVVLEEYLYDSEGFPQEALTRRDLIAQGKVLLLTHAVFAHQTLDKLDRSDRKKVKSEIADFVNAFGMAKDFKWAMRSQRNLFGAGKRLLS